MAYTAIQASQTQRPRASMLLTRVKPEATKAESGQQTT